MLESGGMGMAIGQGSDPLVDITERLSSVLVTSIVSLLFPKINYEIVQLLIEICFLRRYPMRWGLLESNYILRYL